MDIQQERTNAAAAGEHREAFTTNTTLRDAACAFIQAIIDANTDAMEKISHGATVGYPTQYVLKTFGHLYATHRISELTFLVSEEDNRVSVTNGDGKLGDDLRFKRLGDKYFFSHYERY